jgi:hypothetical protein
MFTYRLFNDDILLFESPCEQRHEFASELGAHGSDRKEEVRVLTTLDMMPHASLIHSATRHNTVYVRMVEQIGSPRMEDGSHAGCESLLGSKSINSSPCSFEHTIVKLPLISHRNGMQTCRYREYDMEVLDRDNLFPAELNPLLTLLVLTLGTMSVTTAVIADMHIPALGTHLDMAAKGASPALSHVSENSSDSRHDLMLRKELISITSDNLTNVKFGPHRLGGKMVSIRRTCFIGSISAT